MAVSTKDKQLLLTFPKPPPSLLSPFTPHRPDFPSTPSPRPSPSPSPVYRASDFGFIQVALDTENDDKDSLYNDPPRASAQDPSYHRHGKEAPVSTIIPTALSTVTENPAPKPERLNHKHLQLNLDALKKLYAPLDKITGYVSGWDPTSHIHIILEGRAKTSMHTDSAESTDRALLVYKVVYLPPLSEGQGVVAPRFAVEIPEKTGVDPEIGLEKLVGELGRYWTDDWPAQEPFECQEGHPLPPSMVMPLRTSLSLTARASGRGYVEYKLLAVRSRRDGETGKFIPEASCTMPIWLTTRRLPAEKVQKLTDETLSSTPHLEAQTSQLARARRISLYEQMWDALNTATPSFYFAPTISTPKLSSPGADIQVSISIAVLAPPAGKLYNFPVPDVSISYFTCRIRSYTGIRILRLPHTNPLKPPQSRAHTFKACESRTSSTQPGATFVPKNGAFEKQSCVVTVKLPKTLLTSFKTNNIWRSYKVECDVTFRVAEKEVTAYTRSDLNIVSRPAGCVENSGAGGRMGMEDEDAMGLEMAKAIVGTARTSLGLLLPPGG